MEPYFMLYGEVYAADIDPCTPENAEKDWCKPGAWFVPVMMTIFLLGWFYSIIHNSISYWPKC